MFPLRLSYEKTKQFFHRNSQIMEPSHIAHERLRSYEK